MLILFVIDYIFSESEDYVFQENMLFLFWDMFLRYSNKFWKFFCLLKNKYFHRYLNFTIAFKRLIRLLKITETQSFKSFFINPPSILNISPIFALKPFFKLSVNAREKEAINSKNYKKWDVCIHRIGPNIFPLRKAKNWWKSQKFYIFIFYYFYFSKIIEKNL